MFDVLLRLIHTAVLPRLDVGEYVGAKNRAVHMICIFPLLPYSLPMLCFDAGRSACIHLLSIDDRRSRSFHVEFQVHILDTREICRSAFFYFIWPLRCLCRHPYHVTCGVTRPPGIKGLRFALEFLTFLCSSAQVYHCINMTIIMTITVYYHSVVHATEEVCVEEVSTK